MNYQVNDYRSYLAHHGIKGQKWGVRRAAWYPIADYMASKRRGTAENRVSKSTADRRSITDQGGVRSAAKRTSKIIRKKYINENAIREETRDAYSDFLSRRRNYDETVNRLADIRRKELKQKEALRKDIARAVSKETSNKLVKRVIDTTLKALRDEDKYRKDLIDIDARKKTSKEGPVKTFLNTARDTAKAIEKRENRRKELVKKTISDIASDYKSYKNEKTKLNNSGETQDRSITETNQNDQKKARFVRQQAQRAAEEAARISQQQAQRAAEEAARISRQQAQRAAEEAARISQQQAQRAAEEAARISQQEALRAQSIAVSTATPYMAPNAFMFGKKGKNEDRKVLTKTAKKAYKNYDKLTAKEIDEAIARLNKKQQLRNLSKQETENVVAKYNREAAKIAKGVISTTATLYALEKAINKILMS